MSLRHFTVTQLRTAATCPRIHYFDAIESAKNPGGAKRQTRIWLPGTRDQVGGGALFHTVVERFNRRAKSDAAVLRLIQESEGEVELTQSLMRYVNETCVDLDRLAAKPVQLRRALVDALFQYFDELSAMMNYAISNGRSAIEVVREMFGDGRRRVDVTFHLQDGEAAHVTGAIDYVYFDWRIGGHRVVDYKLTPSDHANRDLFQVSAYALMHHHQHDTQPSAAVFYRYPHRKVVDKSWEQIKDERHKVYNLLASMVRWEEFQEATGTGLRPPGDVTWCAGCKWNKKGQCEQRLGAKSEGEWSEDWRELSSLRAAPEPKTERADPQRLVEQERLEDQDGSEEASVDAEIEEELAAPEQAVPLAAVVSPSPSPQRPTPAAPPGGGPAQGGPEALTAPVVQKSESVEGLLVGHLATQAAVSIPPSVVNTHIAVVGAAGSGKTWTAKVIAEEVAASGVPVLAIDPQGDLVQFLLGADDTNLPPAVRERMRWVRGRIEPRVFTPGTSHGIRIGLNPLRLPRKADLARIEKAARRREEEEGMLQAAAANLVSLAQVGGEEDSQRAYLYQLLERMDREADVRIQDIVQAVLNPENLGLDDVDFLIKKAEREKLARKLHTLVVGPAKNLFSGGVPLELDEMLRPRTPGKIPLNVIYLNALTDDDQKHFFLASLASEIYRWMISSLEPTPGRSSLLFYIDEARDWIPAGTKNPPAKQPLIRLFTQGRKYGVGCLLCTQSPRSVDYNVFGNCSTKIIGRMEASQDIERIKEWFSVSGAPPSWIAERKGASKGSFVGRWPGMPDALEGEAFKGRPLYSAHEAAWSPDRVEREVDRSGLRELFEE